MCACVCLCHTDADEGEDDDEEAAERRAQAKLEAAKEAQMRKLRRVLDAETLQSQYLMPEDQVCARVTHTHTTHTGAHAQTRTRIQPRHLGVRLRPHARARSPRNT